MRAAVVGAGLAGLSAADELRRAGAEVVVLEARDRVGGRVWSRELDNGAVVEMGAEFILPGNTAIRELAERFGLGLWDKGMRYGRREPRGGAGASLAEVEAAAAAAERELDRGAEDPSARRLLERLQIPPGAREALLARVEISSGNSADVVAARDLAGIAHVGDDPAPSIAGGNQSLPLALAESLGRGAVHLRSPVERIAWHPDGVRLRAAGAETEADRCVVAVPASVLPRIRFEPALPDRLADAVAAIRYGQAAKLFVPLRRPAAPSAVMSVPERYWTWTATGDGEQPQPVVSAFAGSRAALARLEIAAGHDRWLASIARLRDDLELELEGALLSRWSDDPWVEAAYSTSPPAEIQASFEQRVGPLAFAGEHAGGKFATLMEGAIRSGQRAAAALLEAPHQHPRPRPRLGRLDPAAFRG
jgi:monoamine oxidase